MAVKNPKVVHRDSLVVTYDGRLGKVENIAVLYQEEKAPKTGVEVYLLLEGKTEIFSPEEVRLRSNSDSHVLHFLEFTDDLPVVIRDVDPMEVF